MMMIESLGYESDEGVTSLSLSRERVSLSHDTQRKLITVYVCVSKIA